MTFSDSQVELLSAKLDGAVVRTRSQGGRDLSYIEGWWAITEANRIFGFGEWTSEVESLQCVVNATQGSPNYQGGREGYLVAYTAHVIVTVGDQRHGDYGYGQGIDFNGNVGQAHESAVKEAVTDGLKRALRHWGSPFGLALYDKDQREVERAPAGKPAPGRRDAPADSDGVIPDSGRAMCHRHQAEWFKKGKMKSYAHPIDDSGSWCDMTRVLSEQLGDIVDRGAITNDEIGAIITGLYGVGAAFGTLQPAQQLAIVAEVSEATEKNDDDSLEF
jgi:DNA recombination protein Rad52